VTTLWPFRNAAYGLAQQDTSRIRRTPMRIAPNGFLDFFSHNCRKPTNSIVMMNVAAKTA
jgi:hypothetical protein